MKQWEYKVVIFREDIVEDQLNVLGSIGFELIAVTEKTDHMRKETYKVAIFKREAVYEIQENT